MWIKWNILVGNVHGYVPLIVNTSRSCPHSFTEFVTRLTRSVPLAGQEMPTLPEHRNPPLSFSGVHVTRSLVLYAYFVDRCLSFCTFSVGHCVVICLRYTNSDYPFKYLTIVMVMYDIRNTYLYTVVDCMIAETHTCTQ